MVSGRGSGWEEVRLWWGRVLFRALSMNENYERDSHADRYGVYSWVNNQEIWSLNKPNKEAFDLTLRQPAKTVI